MKHAFVPILLATTWIASSTPVGRDQASTEDAAVHRARVEDRLRFFSDPTPLIRAANELRDPDPHWSLSDEDVRHLVSAFELSRIREAQVAFHPNRTFWKQVSVTLPTPIAELASGRAGGTSPGWRLMLACFTSTDGALPPSRIEDHARPCSLMGPVSRSWPLLFVGDIPFDVGGAEVFSIPEEESRYLYTLTESPRSLQELMTWAHDHARVENRRLQPQYDPFIAVDSYLDRIADDAAIVALLGEQGLAWIARGIRGQTMRMTSAALSNRVARSIAGARPPLPQGWWEHDADLGPLWAVFRQTATEAWIRWDDASERYIALR